MTASLAMVIVGPFIGAIFGVSVFMFKRTATKTDNQLQDIASNVEIISHQITAVQISMPTNYINKDDFYRHAADEERWQSTVLHQVDLLHDDIATIRSTRKD